MYISDSSQIAVAVKSVIFTHSNSSVEIIKSVSVSVPCNSIYALIGPSGCGKTTLLKLILGLLQPTSGSISIFGYKPGELGSGVPGQGVGYMPQEYAIQSKLTIKEILEYYGRLNGLNSQLVRETVESITRRLRLPYQNRLICTLSGGEKRRVSFAATLLHKPRLLILDEPTVGMDPVLRVEVWNWIRTLAQQKTTVIVTTHYVEEAKADVVAFMRKGQILTEMSPKALLDATGKQSLQDVFLTLAQKHESSGLKHDILCHGELNKALQFTQKLQFQPNSVSHLLVIFLLIKRMALYTLREPYAIICLFVVQMAAMAIGNSIVHRDPIGVRLGVVIDSITYQEFNNQTFCQNLANITLVDEQIHEKCHLNLERLFTCFIDRDIITPIHYQKFDAALSDAVRGKIAGILHFPANFSSSYYHREFSWLKGVEDSDTGEWKSGIPKFYTGNTGQFYDEVLGYLLEKALRSFRSYIAPFCGIRKELVQSSVVVAEVIFGQLKEKGLFTNRLSISGGILILLYSMALGVSAAESLRELEDETFVREYTCGVTSYQLVLARFGALSAVKVVSAGINLLFMQYIIRIHFEAPFFLTFAFLSLVVVLGTVHGVLLANLIVSYSTGLYVGLFFTTVLILTSGFFIPMQALPYFVRIIGDILPFARAVNAMFSLMNYGIELFVKNVTPSVIELCFWLLISLYATVYTTSKV